MTKSGIWLLNSYVLRCKLREHLLFLNLNLKGASMSKTRLIDILSLTQIMKPIDWVAN